MNMLLKQGKLWVIATPIGNPGDLSPRAREVLSRVSLVLAEDTRRSGKLLADCGIHAMKFSSFHDHNEENKLQEVLSLLEKGEELALISDAGTPLLSDPGYRLVRACKQAGIAVSPLPGPCAPVAALSASGIAPLPFIFLGFAPRKTSGQHSFFSPFANLTITLIFFERKDRLKATLATAFDVLGNRESCIAREITKTYEEFIPFSLSEYESVCENLLGEITVIIGPAGSSDVKTAKEVVLSMASKELALGKKPKDAAKSIHKHIIGWTVKDIYKVIEDIKAE